MVRFQGSLFRKTSPRSLVRVIGKPRLARIVCGELLICVENQQFATHRLAGFVAMDNPTSKALTRNHWDGARRNRSS
jgi:hypothetical protein